MKMSTGRRLAKRSIIGTKVCAPGPDGLWYSGVIQDIKIPPSATVTSDSVSADNTLIETKYLVRFDFKTQDSVMEPRRAVSVHISPAQSLRRNAMIKEFHESDLIGPGFRSIMGIQLQPGQRVYLTFNGRETSGDVIKHDSEKDEVLVKITTIGSEGPIELKKRLEELRLLESRRSARLADQERDTDFARLADMSGDRRKPSHSIEVPFSTTPQNNSRKRPPSYAHDGVIGVNYNEEEMNENNAAMILVTLSLSPKSPKNGEKWLGSSPGSSSASWSSGSSSPPLSDDGHNMSVITNNDSASARLRTTSVSTSDEGIVVDFKEEEPRRKRPNKSKFVCTWKGCNISEHTKAKIERHIRIIHLGYKKVRRTADIVDSDSHDSDSHEEEFYYTEVEDDDDDCKTPSPTSPPTLSHRDMARPPHEDPEYQRQLVGNFKQGRAAAQLQHQKQNIQQINVKSKTHNNKHPHNSNNHQSHTIYMGSQQLQQLQNNNTSCIPTSPLAHHNYTWPPAKATTANQHAGNTNSYQPQQQPPTATFIKHARSSPRPSQSAAPYPSPTYVHQHHNYSSPAPHSPNSNNTVTLAASTVVQHNNSNASSVLQQLSQQNITVTATHQNTNSHQNHQQHHHTQQQLQQLATVTITPNYTHSRGVQQHQDNSSHHNHQLQQQQQQTRLQQSPTTTTASHRIVAPNTSSNNCNTSSVSNLTSPPIAGNVTTAIATVAATATNAAHHVHQQHVAVQHANKQTPNSPNRRTRGENKKCRKVYGMDRREMWCTQCRWKKACSRFGD